MERCTRCKVLTEYHESTPIDLRDYYIEGSGQLCKACFLDVYGPDNGSPESYQYPPKETA